MISDHGPWHCCRTKVAGHTSKPGPDSDPDSDSKKIRTRVKPGPGLEQNPDSCLKNPDLTFENPDSK
jgi:hypothetical protein